MYRHLTDVKHVGHDIYITSERVAVGDYLTFYIKNSYYTVTVTKVVPLNPTDTAFYTGALTAVDELNLSCSDDKEGVSS